MKIRIRSREIVSETAIEGKTNRGHPFPSFRYNHQRIVISRIRLTPKELLDERRV